MSEMTPFQAVAKIRSLVGMPSLRLPHGADEVDWRIEDDTIVLKYQVNKVASRRGGEVVTPQSIVMHTWNRTEEGWDYSTVSVKPNRKGQYIAGSNYTSPAEQAARDTWARMCYRPGNRAAPMDRGSI